MLTSLRIKERQSIMRRDSATIVIGLAVVGLVVAGESTHGRVVDLVARRDSGLRGGGICYSALSANDKNCLITSLPHAGRTNVIAGCERRVK